MQSIVSKIEPLKKKSRRQLRAILILAAEILRTGATNNEKLADVAVSALVRDKYDASVLLCTIEPPDGILTDLPAQRENEAAAADKLFEIYMKMKEAGVTKDYADTLEAAQTEAGQTSSGGSCIIFITPLKSLLNGGTATALATPVSIGGGGVPSRSINIFHSVDLVNQDNNFTKYVVCHEMTHWMSFQFAGSRLGPSKPFAPHDAEFIRYTDARYRKLRKSEGATDADIDKEIVEHKKKIVD